MNNPRSWGGTLIGTAVGDAWGYPVEFDSYETITTNHPDGLPFPDGVAEVSDDTQMTLALADALTSATLDDPRSIKDAIVTHFHRWRDDPDNNRAPGNTCMSALFALDGDPAREFTSGITDSKGCGAVMRTAPCAFLPDHLRAGVAAYQTVLTHAHPVAVATSIVFTDVVAALADGLDTQAVLGYATERTDQWLRQDPDQAWVDEWLSGVPQRAGYDTATEYLRVGFTELAAYLDQVNTTVQGWDRGGDVCAVAGEGWVAEEAMGGALLAFLSHPDPATAVQYAATSVGDSDSIAALTGALAGAAHGDAVFADQFTDIEPRYWLHITGLASLAPPRH